MKKTSLILTLAALFAACSGGEKNANTYTITGTLPKKVSAEWVYIYDFDGQTPIAIDSARVKNGTFRFEGTCPDSNAMFMMSPGALDQYPAISWTLLMEPANLVADTTDEFLSGGPLNDGLRSWMNQVKSIFATSADANALGDFFRTRWNEHSGDYVGAFMLTSLWTMIDFNLADSLAQTLPDEMKNDRFVNKNLLVPLQALREMQPGHMFKDIDLTTLDGQAVHLADYIGKGDYVLVDFWASWCGPCRKAIPEIQPIVKKYKKLKVLGIAINDKPEETQRAIENLNITWPVVADKDVNSGRIYGFSSIPYMILFAPDGTIAARGFHTDTLNDLLSQNVK